MTLAEIEALARAMRVAVLPFRDPEGPDALREQMKVLADARNKIQRQVKESFF